MVEKWVDFGSMNVSGSLRRNVHGMTAAQKTAAYRKRHPERVTASYAAWLSNNREANRQRCKAYRERRAAGV